MALPTRLVVSPGGTSGAPTGQFRSFKAPINCAVVSVARNDDGKLIEAPTDQFWSLEAPINCPVVSVARDDNGELTETPTGQFSSIVQ